MRREPQGDAHLRSAEFFDAGAPHDPLPLHRGASLYVVYPSARNVPLRVTAFRDLVVEAFATWSARQGAGG